MRMTATTAARVATMSSFRRIADALSESGISFTEEEDRYQANRRSILIGDPYGGGCALVFVNDQYSHFEIYEGGEE